jgi:ParB family chromosome partitioning protein
MTTSGLQHLPVEQLVRGRYQPRQQFGEIELNELAESIRTTNGLLQPIIVRRVGEQYEIIAGERRWHAAIQAGLEEVPCIIKHYSDQQALEAAIIENVNRVDLNPVEEAHAYERLMEEFDYTHEQIAQAVGKSRTKITNTLRLLKLDGRVQQALMDGDLSEGHGKILASLPFPQQNEFANKVINSGWSVRKLEQEVKKAPLVQSQQKDSNLTALERALSDHVGCKVRINCEETAGKLEINFHNLDVLEGLFAKMGFDFKS